MKISSATLFVFMFAVACGGNVKYNANEELVSKTSCETRYENGEVVLLCNGAVVNVTDIVNKEIVRMAGNVDALRGPQGNPGPRGDAGRDGRDGTDGLPGERGPQGVAGLDGTNGRNGQNGFDGTNGIDGRNGTDGAEGDSCWDLNGNGLFDDEEDTDDDGRASSQDCVYTKLVLSKLLTRVLVPERTSDPLTNYFSAELAQFTVAESGPYVLVYGRIATYTNSVTVGSSGYDVFSNEEIYGGQGHYYIQIQDSSGGQIYPLSTSEDASHFYLPSGSYSIVRTMLFNHFMTSHKWNCNLSPYSRLGETKETHAFQMSVDDFNLSEHPGSDGGTPCNSRNPKYIGNAPESVIVWTGFLSEM